MEQSFINKRAKASGEAVTGDGDLVSDVKSGRKALDAVPESDLPEDMRKLTVPQRQAKIDTHMSERKALNDKLSALVAKQRRLRGRETQGRAETCKLVRRRRRSNAESADQAVAS